MNSVIGSNSGAPTLTPEDQKKLKKALDEINDSMTRKAAEADLVKEIVNKVHDELGLNKRLIRRLAKTHFKRDFDMEVQENKDFEEVYEYVTGAKT